MSRARKEKRLKCRRLGKSRIYHAFTTMELSYVVVYYYLAWFRLRRNKGLMKTRKREPTRVRNGSNTVNSGVNL